MAFNARHSGSGDTHSHRVVIKRQSGSHRMLQRAGWPDFVFAFHDNDEIGPRMLARIAKRTGIKPDDL